MTNFITTNHTNECSILSIIEWIKDNVQGYLQENKILNSCNLCNEQNKSCSQKTIVFSRLWIYSHHIYSVNKRKNITQWAKELNLKGFSMPGKPGMICVEGEQANVQDYWQRLRSLNWHRLQVKETQTFTIESSKFKEYAKFNNFEEKIFSANNDSNIDIGLLFVFLKENGFQSIFNLYFGVDGKLPTTNSSQSISQNNFNNNNNNNKNDD